MWSKRVSFNAIVVTFHTFQELLELDYRAVYDVVGKIHITFTNYNFLVAAAIVAAIVA